MKAIIVLFLSLSSYAQIVTIPDANFKNALIEEGVDTNNDGEIQVSEAEVVINLDVSFKDIMSLEGIQSFINLEVLNNSYNQIGNLDLSQNINLISLHCGSNMLTNLDVSQNLSLEELSCFNNQLTNLNITQNQNLKIVLCDNNLLSSLDVSQNPILETVSLSENPISNLDLSVQTLLVEFYCINCQLNSLNIKNGNNVNMVNMVTIGNSNLTCIQVDDENATYPECDILPFTGWCIDDWTSYSEDCSLGLLEIKDATIGLYPNPVEKILYIKQDGVLRITKTELYDISGKLLNEWNTEIKSVDMSKFPPGLYFIKLVTKAGVVSKKIIKQ